MDDTASLICNFYLSIAHTIVFSGLKIQITYYAEHKSQNLCLEAFLVEEIKTTTTLKKESAMGKIKLCITYNFFLAKLPGHLL